MSRPYVSPHLGKLLLAHDLDERGAVRKIRTALEGMIPGGATDADAQSVLDALGIDFDASPED